MLIRDFEQTLFQLRMSGKSCNGVLQKNNNKAGECKMLKELAALLSFRKKGDMAYSSINLLVYACLTDPYMDFLSGGAIRKRKFNLRRGHSF